ncbi:stressosome-associated protein Prli42 [Paenibacillus sp. SYP-B4298]|nr:stressosome-associated protein Prli42 [Paenibacillus sp. SYP-B4298]
MQNNKWVKIVVYLIIASMLLSTLVMSLGLIFY